MDEVVLIANDLGDITDITPDPTAEPGTWIVAGARAAARWRPGSAHRVFVRFNEAWKEIGRENWTTRAFGPQVIDLDADGTPEFVDLGNDGRTLVQVLEFDGRRRFKVQVPTGGAFDGSFVIPIDRDLDGRMELIIGNAAKPYAGVWARDGTFLNEIALIGKGRIHATQRPTVVDVNADGSGDLVYGSQKGLIGQSTKGDVLVRWPLPRPHNYFSEIQLFRPDAPGVVRLGVLANGKAWYDVAIDQKSLAVTHRVMSSEAPQPALGERISLRDGGTAWVRKVSGLGFVSVIASDEEGRVIARGTYTAVRPYPQEGPITEKGVLRRHPDAQDKLILGYANAVHVLTLESLDPP